MKVFTAKQMRHAEQEAATTAGVSKLKMMENAGNAAATVIKAERNVAEARCVAVCGNGGNGGDGFVVLRKLVEAGAQAAAVLVSGYPVNADAAKMLDKLDALGVRVFRWQDDPSAAASMIAGADLLIDGIFGIGFHGQPNDDVSAAIGCINSVGVPVYALDVPSGVEADTGRVAESCVKADVTVVFSLPKFAHVEVESAAMCGDVHVVDVGIPGRILEAIPSDVEVTDHAFVRTLLPRRAMDAHKGDCGRMLAICGSYSMPGAALMCASAALRSGVGLVCMAIPENAYSFVAGRLYEPTYLPLPCKDDKLDGVAAARVLLPEIKRADSIVIGCGLTDREELLPVLSVVLTEAKCPVVIDADGINLLSRHMHMLQDASAELILTPHPGEMSRLTGLPLTELRHDRIPHTVETAASLGATVVLKGSHTVTATPDGRVYCNPNGNPGMAVGGCGDVLSGIVGSLCAQGVEPSKAAAMAVYLHGASGDHCVERLTHFGMTPTDLIGSLPEVFREILA